MLAAVGTRCFRIRCLNSSPACEAGLDALGRRVWEVAIDARETDETGLAFSLARLLVVRSGERNRDGAKNKPRISREVSLSLSVWCFRRNARLGR